QIGEFKILNMILDEKFKDVLQFGERVLKISLKPKNEIGKQERDFITQEIKLEKNRENLREFSYKLFQLYALIETKLREEVRI
ncbi:MAG: hypothetical protein NZ891_01945, partial [bacterium]|nr:hypothetical protein [bacterium]MDW8163491.1 hypothetical protein [Candidatus Omnitrophota bacterium]